MSTSMPLPWRLVATCSVLFVISRAYLAFWYPTQRGDMELYAHYAFEVRDAFSRGDNVYNVHTKTALLDPENPERSVIEYPPLALFWVAFPTLFTDLPASAGGEPALQAWSARYKAIYFCFDLALFAVLGSLALSTRSIGVGGLGLGAFIASGVMLYDFYYERLDLWTGGLVLFAVVSMLRGKGWALAYFFLALAINFKIVPLLLAPAFIFASMPAHNSGWTWRAVGLRAAALAALTALIFTPFLWLWGPETLGFLGYHAARGLQLESTYSSLLLGLSWLGHPVFVAHQFGAFNVESPWAQRLAQISGPLVALVVVGIAARFLADIRRKMLKAEGSTGMCIAQAYPREFIACVLATMIASMVCAKVLSPQYFLWLAPLFPLVETRTRLGRVAQAAFLILCIATATIPLMYYTDFVHAAQRLGDGRVSFGRPTDSAIGILLFRNALLAGLAVLMVRAGEQSFTKARGNNRDF